MFVSLLRIELAADWVRRRPRRLPPQAAKYTRRPQGRLRSDGRFPGFGGA